MHRVVTRPMDVRDFAEHVCRNGFIAADTVGEEECLGVAFMQRSGELD